MENKILKLWIDACINNSAGRLTPWETSFIESVSEQLDRRGSLSEKQEEILERIYSEKTK